MSQTINLIARQCRRYPHPSADRLLIVYARDQPIYEGVELRIFVLNVGESFPGVLGQFIVSTAVSAVYHVHVPGIHNIQYLSFSHDVRSVSPVPFIHFAEQEEEWYPM